MCTCIANANAKLATLNTIIDEGMLIDPKTRRVTSRVHLAVRKLAPKIRQGPAVIVCTYCPFCGEKWPELT